MQSILSQVFKYWHTIRYLRPIQFYGRIKLFFKSNRIQKSYVADLNEVSGKWAIPARKQQSIFSENLVSFLNKPQKIISIDDWNNDNWPKLWLYNLHYFDDLNSYEASSRHELHCSFINRWIKENPIGKGIGWDSYPISLRIVNWIKWALAGNKLEKDWLSSLQHQARCLSNNLEIHLMGNHFFTNAKALLYVGSFFTGVEADIWREKGLKIIQKELIEQVLEDGANFELSTMYHMIFLEDLLDIINIHIACKKSIPENIFERIDMMFRWLEAMCHPDGEISFFNDAAFGITPSVAELKDYRKRVYRNCNRIIDKNDISKKSITEFKKSGYSRVELSDMVAIVDCAAIGPDYLPGHAHADTLSFELSLFGHRLIVNSGTSTYEHSESRQQQRSTLSHSTVEINGQDSSQVWSAFRVARRAKVIKYRSKKVDNKIIISACHDGYKKLPGKIIHCREWIFDDCKLTIKDKITGRGECNINSTLPIHPEVNLKNIIDNCAELEINGKKILIFLEGNGKLIDMKSRYHREFGNSVENFKLVYSAKEVLPIELVTRISW